MFIPIYEGGFSRQLKKAKKRGKDMEKLKKIIKDFLLPGKILPPHYRNHKLLGTYKDCWECHIEPDWLLIYKKTDKEIIFVATGTHSDLF